MASPNNKSNKRISNRKEVNRKNPRGVGGIREKGIPSIPFDHAEVNDLINGIAPSDLSQRFIIWKISDDYQMIKLIEARMISGNNCKSSPSSYTKELREQYFDWLVSIESDKFRALESVRLPINLASNHRGDEESHEEGQ